MRNLVFLTGAALIMAAPASAQDVMAAPPAADTTMPAEPAMPPADMSAPGAPAAAADAAAPAAPAADVQAQWAQYDKDSKGYLTPLEFGSWLLARQGQDMTATVEKSRTGKQANLPAIKVLNATAAEFSKADTDKNYQISPQEFADYQTM